jgi:hypothetical protein
MVGKVKRLVVTIALSVVVLIATGVVCAWLAGLIVGSSKQASGDEVLNGGGTTSLVIFAVCAVATIGFGIWFYKFYTKIDASKVKDNA